MISLAKIRPDGVGVFPDMIEVQGIPTPAAPRDVESTGLDRGFLSDLTLKTVQRVPHCTTKWTAEQMRLPIPVAEDLLQQLKEEKLVEMLGLEGPFNHRYAITNRGHERVLRIQPMSGYAGPAPVSLEAYGAMTHFHHSHLPEVTLEQVKTVLADLVLPPDDLLTAALAVMSHRSLFLFGPSGNGKTSMACLLHDVFQGDIWVPHAIAVGSQVIRLFDPQMHQEAAFTAPQAWKVDQRWVRIRRPLIIAGGEMTIESLELCYSPAQGLYEAPLHLKSNCGTFVIDDFGRQRVDPTALLNRWIIPLEHGYDYLVFPTGVKIKVPFQQMLVVSTNLEPKQVTDPAFLRRMGYRLHMAPPTPERYQDIFRKHASRWGMELPPDLMGRLLERYRLEGRELRGCEPRDLVGRVRDICQLRRRPMEFNDEVFDVAWTSYFGTKRQHPS
ncbi:MAG: ATP-binding protein [Planctomycetes bacterium]|nr:ATP-binding protein [Planctomycetota bacterium]